MRVFAVDGLLDEDVHAVNIKTVLLFDELCLGLLTGEGVTDEAQLQGEVVGSRWVFEVSAGWVEQLDELVDYVTENMVFHRGVRYFQVGFFKDSFNLGKCFTSWLSSFDWSGSFNLWVNDFSKVDFVLADKCCGPLVLVSEVVNQL